MTTEELVRRFKEIYKKQNHGKELSDQAAFDGAMRLVKLVKAIYRPIPKNQQDKRDGDKNQFKTPKPKRRKNK